MWRMGRHDTQETGRWFRCVTLLGLRRVIGHLRLPSSPARWNRLWAGINRPESWTPARQLGRMGGRFLNCFKILRLEIFIQTKIFHWAMARWGIIVWQRMFWDSEIIYEDETAERERPDTGPMSYPGPCHNFQNREREILITITRSANLIHGWPHVRYLSHTTCY